MARKRSSSRCVKRISSDENQVRGAERLDGAEPAYGAIMTYHPRARRAGTQWAINILTTGKEVTDRPGKRNRCERVVWNLDARRRRRCDAPAPKRRPWGGATRCGGGAALIKAVTRTIQVVTAPYRVGAPQSFAVVPCPR